MKTKLASHILFSLTLLAMGIRIAQAAPTPTISPSPAPTASEKAQQIEDLKERLATKVAELRQAQRMAVFGTVKSVSISQFTVETKTKDLKIELTDDIKIFQNIKGVRKELTAENLEKGDIVTVFGEYDTTLEFLNAKVVFIQSTDPVRISGTIKETSKADYTITIETPESKTYTIDFETTTKTMVWNGKELAKGGFSKLAVGNAIHVTGTAVAKQENRVSATRITNIGSDVTGATTTPSPTIAPSPTASNAATPTATIKPTPKP